MSGTEQMDGLPAWLVQLGELAAAGGAMLGLLLKREDTLRKDAVAFHTTAMKAVADEHKSAHDAIELAKREASEALMAHANRTDSRHEAIRQELNMHVAALGQRIDRIGDAMTRREDLDPLMQAIAALTQRVDRVLELNSKH